MTQHRCRVLDISRCLQSASHPHAAAGCSFTPLQRSQEVRQFLLLVNLPVSSEAHAARQAVTSSEQTLSCSSPPRGRTAHADSRWAEPLSPITIILVFVSDNIAAAATPLRGSISIYTDSAHRAVLDSEPVFSSEKRVSESSEQILAPVLFSGSKWRHGGHLCFAQ